MKRLSLFLATNLAVLSIVFQVYGVEQWLCREDAGINVQGLPIISAPCAMGGAFASLALSNWRPSASPVACPRGYRNSS